MVRRRSSQVMLTDGGRKRHVVDNNVNQRGMIVKLGDVPVKNYAKCLERLQSSSVRADDVVA